VLSPFRLLVNILLHYLKVFACGGWGWGVSTKAIVSSTRLLTKLSRQQGVSPTFKVNVAALNSSINRASFNSQRILATSSRSCKAVVNDGVSTHFPDDSSIWLLGMGHGKYSASF
jgi:hypothetical protein